jgi:glycosyltransferase involved in cell wall biosynthesis
MSMPVAEKHEPASTTRAEGAGFGSHLMPTSSNQSLGFARTVIVVIGRNEGERLKRCLQSIHGKAHLIVYVDSGSADNSVELAQGFGATIVQLDMSRPFTAARARNEGFRAAVRQDSAIEFVQFLDGDTEMDPQWLVRAHEFMAENARVAVVFGRRRERDPRASLFNEICDIEWDVPVGAANYCGGDVLLRREPFQKVDGFTESLIAGEEPDLCVRLRKESWLIHCLQAEMTQHDAAMFTVNQWWKRAVRSGHAFAEGASRFGKPPDFHWIRESRRSLIWGLLVPAVILGLSVVESPWYLFGLLAYPARLVRIYWRSHGTNRRRWIRAWFYTVACFPEAWGAVTFWFNKVFGKQAKIIEYK